MNKKTICILLLFTKILYAQEEKVLGTRNGVKITAQTILEKEEKKKDKYTLVVNAVNESKNDLYYKADVKEEMDVAIFGKKDTVYKQVISNDAFANVIVRNATQSSFFKGKAEVPLKGENTDNITSDERGIVYVLRRDEYYSSEYTFKVKKGEKPIITNRFLKNFKKSLNAFDLRSGTKALDGHYTASCGNVKVTVHLKKPEASSSDRKEYLIVTANGKQSTWTRTSANSFIRSDDKEVTLTFNKGANSFNYSNSDGMTCIWTKDK